MSSNNKIKIPESQSENFKFLLNLPFEARQELTTVINSVPIGISQSSLYTLLRDSIKTISPNKLSELYSIYVNLSRAKEDLKLNDEEFITNLKSALEEVEDLSINDYSEESLAIFFELFNSNNVINKSRRIENEYVQNEKNFDSIKITTDIRTLFERNEFIGSTIVNKLKISYIEDEEIKSIYITIDNHDIEEIINDLKDTQKNNNYIQENFKNLELISLVK